MQTREIGENRVAKKRISELTAGEAMDELAFYEFERVLARAKRRFQKSGNGLEDILKTLDYMCIDADSAATSQPDSASLKETVIGFLEGKYGQSAVMKVVRAMWVRMDGEASGF